MIPFNLVASAGCAMAAVIWLSSPPSAPAPHDTPTVTATPVWPRGGAEEVARWRRPILFRRGSPADNWPALQRWRSLAYIERSMPVLTNVTIQRGRYLYRDSAKPLSAAAAASGASAGPASLPRVNTSWLFKQLLSGSADVYYGRALEDWTALASDVDPWPFELPSANARDPSWRRGSWAQVWLHGGHVTNGHYDVRDNFFVQVRGSRTFALGWPARHQQRQLFPFASEHHRQVKPGTFSPTAGSVTLGPGDVLFLPAFVFHEVSSPPGDVSIGVSVFSNCAECDAAALLRAAPLPGAIVRTRYTAQGLEQRLGAAAALLLAAPRAAGLGDGNAFLADLLDERFHNAAAGAEGGDPRVAARGTDGRDSSNLLVGGIVDFDPERCPRIPTGDEEQSDLARTMASIGGVASSLRALHNRSHAPPRLYSQGVLRLLVSNYLEQLVLGIVGPERTEMLLRCVVAQSKRGIT